jgi:Spy/CpxP family protein refolding chaperone
MTGRVASWLTPLMLAVALAALGQPAQGADGKEPVKKMLFSKVRERGRLPAHYAPVVTSEQREKIYDIQEEYKAKIDPLEAQVKALTKERDDKIAAVLTPEQRKKIEDAQTQTKAKTAAEKSGDTAPPAPAEQKPAN